MDRRSWLWRRKSTEKSPGEIEESSGGSISSYSERFSDDQSCQSPEVTSKAEEELEGGFKTLSQKLSEALLNISIKEDLVKQHSKVAEEAVEGWEKAEAEVLALRQQIEVLTLRNSSLEDRVSHLDGALKECLRQLRQTREESDEKMEEAIRNKTSELENQLSDLRSQLQSAERTESSIEENTALKLELASMAEELELRFIERELSNQAAQEAIKLQLESSKRAAKFEGECRRLNAALRKAKDERSIVKEMNEIESNRKTPAMEIKLMDDFLEMERLVALPERRPLQNRMSEVEEALKRVEMEKHKAEMALNECEKELKTSRNEVKVAKLELAKLQGLLMNANDAREKEVESVKETVSVLQERVKGSEQEVVELKSQLHIDRIEAESRLKDAYTKKREAESRLTTLEPELESLILKVNSLETEVGRERDLSGKLGAKCWELETKLKSVTLKVGALEAEVQKEQDLSGKLRAKCQRLETELDLSVTRCQEFETERESMILKIDSLKTEIEVSKKMGFRSRELEDEISRLHEYHYLKPAIQNPNLQIKQEEDTELALLAGSRFADCQKTIASLSRQLKTLAALEDFLIDTNEFSRRV